MKRTTLALLVFSFYLLVFPALSAQSQPRVLFIGNSYTEYNNLPQMTADVARSMGYEMVYSSNTPGGCTFQQHCTNQSMTLIQQGDWDFVVLQEQSQYPSFPQNQVEAEVFPYAAQLVESVYAANPCAEPMFYMTWGRRDGDQGNAPYFPVLGTYEGMDSMLYLRYLYMAEANDASVCPVGRVWRNLRENHPEIELYQSDGSHPSIAGTYAAACAFAVMFFHGDPLTVTYLPDNLPEDVAATIRTAVHEVVYTQQQQWHRPQPQASVQVGDITAYEATFVVRTAHADSLFLDFGDTHTLTHLHINTLAIDTIVHHTYVDTGDYLVTLIVSRHCMADTAVATLHIAIPDTTGIAQFSIVNSQLSITPNPSSTLPVIMLDGKDVGNQAVVTTPDGHTLPYSALHNDAPAGVYLIRVHSDGKTRQGKFIKM